MMGWPESVAAAWIHVYGGLQLMAAARIRCPRYPVNGNSSSSGSDVYLGPIGSNDGLDWALFFYFLND